MTTMPFNSIGIYNKTNVKWQKKKKHPYKKDVDFVIKDIKIITLFLKKLKR